VTTFEAKKKWGNPSQSLGISGGVRFPRKKERKKQKKKNSARAAGL